MARKMRFFVCAGILLAALTVHAVPARADSAAVAGSEDTLKWLPDSVGVQVNGAVVTMALDSFFYVERGDRSFGIWVNSPNAYISQGSLVNVAGNTATSSGERFVDASSGTVTQVDYNTYPLPGALGLSGKATGGGAAGPHTPAVGNSTGLNNTG